MFRFVSVKDLLKFWMPSGVRQCGPGVELGCRFFRRCGLSSYEGHETVLRELLQNAIVHGNKCAAHRLVTCTVRRVPPGDIEITVEDEGAGFDHEGLIRNGGLGRGLSKVMAAADVVEFKGTGNRVVAMVRAD